MCSILVALPLLSSLISIFLLSHRIMFSIAPPLKMARTQRSTVTSTPNRSIHRSSAAVGSSASNALFDCSEVASSQLGKHITWVVDRHGTLQCWLTSFGGKAVGISSLRQTGVDARYFVGEGWKGESIIRCDGEGVVEISFNDGTRDSISLLADADDDTTIAAFTAEDGKIVAATSDGNVLYVNAHDGTKWKLKGSDLVKSEQAESTGGRKTTGGSWWSAILGKPRQSTTNADGSPGVGIEALFWRQDEESVKIFACTANGIATIDVTQESQPVVVSYTALTAFETSSICVRDVAFSGGMGYCLISNPDLSMAVVPFNLSLGRCVGQVIALSAPESEIHNSIHCIRNKVVVVTHPMMITVEPSAGVRHQESEEIERLSSAAVGARSDGSTTLLLFTTKGFTCVGADLGNVSKQSLSDEQVVSQILARDGSRQSPSDNANCIAENILKAIEVNPANWARGDLDSEDDNLLTFVTNALHRKANTYHRFLHQAFSSSQVLEALNPRTKAGLVSDHEKLACMTTIRELQNEPCSTIRVEHRQNLLKQVVAATAKMLRAAGSTEEQKYASAAEVVYAHPKALIPILKEINRTLQSVVESPSPVIAKVNLALAAGDVWQAVLAAVTKSRLDFKMDSEVLPFMWSRTEEVESAMLLISTLMSSVLAAVVGGDQRTAGAHEGGAAFTHSTSKSSEDSSNLLQLLDGIVRSLLEHHSQSETVAKDVIQRTLLKDPFVSTPFGYPHGNPKPNPSHGICRDVLLAAESIALHFSTFDTLFTLSMSEVIHDPLEAFDRYERLRAYSDRHPPFYKFVLRQLLRQHREREADQLPKLVPEMPRGEAERNEFFAEEAPHVHFIADPYALRSIMEDGRRADNLLLGDDKVEHRVNCLALAKLSWVCGDRKGGARRITDETRIAKAQRDFLPTATDKNLDAQGAVASLLESPEKDAWVRAAAIADSVLEDAIRTRLLLACVLHSATQEAKELEAILVNSTAGAGESETTERINQTTTSKVCSASNIVRRWLVSRDESLHNEMKAKGQESLWRLLCDWCRSSFSASSRRPT